MGGRKESTPLLISLVFKWENETNSTRYYKCTKGKNMSSSLSLGHIITLSQLDKHSNNFILGFYTAVHVVCKLPVILQQIEIQRG